MERRRRCGPPRRGRAAGGGGEGFLEAARPRRSRIPRFVRPSISCSLPAFLPLAAAGSRTKPDCISESSAACRGEADGWGEWWRPCGRPARSFVPSAPLERGEQILFRVFPNFLSRAPVNVGGLAPSLLLQVPRQVALESRQLRLEALHLALRVLRRALLLLLEGSSCQSSISSYQAQTSSSVCCSSALALARGGGARARGGRPGGEGGHGGLLRPERHPGGGDGAPRGRRRPLARPRRRPCPEGGCSRTPSPSAHGGGLTRAAGRRGRAGGADAHEHGDLQARAGHRRHQPRGGRASRPPRAPPPAANASPSPRRARRPPGPGGQ